jgi:lysylphosphatidylglycerol synthetase-like protein (DUF2156 family)
VNGGQKTSHSSLVADTLLPKDTTWNRAVHGGLALAWLAALAAHLYVADTTVHAADVGAYVPAWVLAAARIAAWVFLLPAAVDAVPAMLRRVPFGLSRGLAIASFALLIVYAAIAIAALFYVAFSPYGA